MNTSSTVEQAELEDLIARTALHNRAAFRKLYERTSPLVLGFLTKMLGNKTQAEDVLQDTYLKIWASAKQYRAGQGLVMSWIYTIARYRAIDSLRSDKRRSEVMGEQRQNLEIDILEKTEHIDDEAIRYCLEQLPSVQREGIVEAFYSGWTYQELAQRFSIPIATMKTRIRRGLMRLKSCLES